MNQPAQVALEQLDDLAALEPAWSMLAERSGNVFATWEWAHLWWRHFGMGRRLLTVLCRDSGGRVVAILPLYLERRWPFRVVRFVGHGVSDEQGPICAPEDSGHGAAALQQALAKLVPRCDAIVAERLPAGGGWMDAVDGRTLRREASPVVNIEGVSWDEYLRSRSQNFRSQVRRKERKLINDHGLAYRLASDPARLPADMETLFSLHRARWGETGSRALSGARARFHRDFATVALEHDWLRLWFAEIDGRAVAAWYGFRFGGAEWYYQFGRDPAWDRLSLGFVLFAHTLREAIHDGMREYKLLLGADPYKYRFATADPGLETIVLSRGPRGRTAALAASAYLVPHPARRVAARAIRGAHIYARRVLDSFRARRAGGASRG